MVAVSAFTRRVESGSPDDAFRADPPLLIQWISRRPRATITRQIAAATAVGTKYAITPVPMRGVSVIPLVFGIRRRGDWRIRTTNGQSLVDQAPTHGLGDRGGAVGDAKLLVHMRE